MSFESILDLKLSTYKDLPQAAYFLDLNLKQIMDQINLLWGDNVTSLYYFPADKECEEYRREVFADVKKPQVYEMLCSFIGDMQLRQRALNAKEKVERKEQLAVWHLREVSAYSQAYTKLYETMKTLPLESKGMLSLQEELAEYLSSEEYGEMKEKMQALMEELYSIRVVLTYENNQIIVSENVGDREYEKFLEKGFPEHKAQMRSPFAQTPELTSLEQEIMRIMFKKRPAFFRELNAFYKQYEKYEREKLIRFYSEIVYYLSFVKFENKMKELGFLFAAPVTCERKDFSAEGLYDLALACVNSKNDKPVISNQFAYREGEQFFVLTGPNQGGKTTFARSLGQLIFFGKLGFDVPAASARIPYFKHILTHFSVEESLETGRGKLKEELVRLAPMMDSTYENTFVIINELFTTAANYDACIMGNRVLEHFIKQNCMGIYVTHLKELTEGHKEVVSIRATLDANNVQNFKIIRSAAEESAHAVNQVNKYKLTYEQLKRRLS